METLVLHEWPAWGDNKFGREVDHHDITLCPNRIRESLLDSLSLKSTFTTQKSFGKCHQCFVSIDLRGGVEWSWTRSRSISRKSYLCQARRHIVFRQAWIVRYSHYKNTNRSIYVLFFSLAIMKNIYSIGECFMSFVCGHRWIDKPDPWRIIRTRFWKNFFAICGMLTAFHLFDTSAGFNASILHPNSLFLPNFKPQQRGAHTKQEEAAL